MYDFSEIFTVSDIENLFFSLQGAIEFEECEKKTLTKQ